VHQSFLLHNPGIEIVYYDNDAARAFIGMEFPYGVSLAMESLLPGAYKADLLRYCIMYRFGGMYGDLTQQYILPMRDLISFEEDELVLVADRSTLCDGKKIPGIQIAFMAAIPKLPVFKTAIELVVQNTTKNEKGCNPLATTGPSLFAKALGLHPEQRYRMELQQEGHDKYTYIDRRKGNGSVVLTKTPDHHTSLGKRAHYSDMWDKDEVFKRVENRPSHIPPFKPGMYSGRKVTLENVRELTLG